MMNRYAIVTPSLDGIIRHESIEYDGLKRPPEISQIFDRPRKKDRYSNNKKTDNIESQKIIEGYFHDLYGIFMKKLSQFAVEDNPPSEEALKLMAMLQEFIKVKQLLAGKKQIT